MDRHIDCSFHIRNIFDTVDESIPQMLSGRIDPFGHYRFRWDDLWIWITHWDARRGAFRLAKKANDKRLTAHVNLIAEWLERENKRNQGYRKAVKRKVDQLPRANPA